MSQVKPCIFVASRECPFKVAKVPFQTCQLCIEAWKTEVSLKGQQQVQVPTQPAPTQSPESEPQHINAQVDGAKKPVFYDDGLHEIDELLKDGAIDPIDYVRLRKQQIDNLMNRDRNGKLILSIGLDAPDNKIESSNRVHQVNQISQENPDIQDSQSIPIPVDELAPELTKGKVAVVVKTAFGKQVYTSPNGWKLPKTINDKVLNSLFKLTSQKKAKNIRLRAGDHKIACIRHDKGKYALLVIDADEEFEAYDDEIERLSEFFAGADYWANVIMKLNRGRPSRP